MNRDLIRYIDLESIYIKEINDTFDIDKIAKSGLNFAFDAMYGSSQNVLPKLLPGLQRFHCEINPSFKGIPPEPVRKNMHELVEFVWRKQEYRLQRGR